MSESGQDQFRVSLNSCGMLPLRRVREGRVADLLAGCFAALVRNLDFRSMVHSVRTRTWYGFVRLAT